MAKKQLSKNEIPLVSGKSLMTEKETHELMARVCGKSETQKNLDTFISGTTKTFRDVFVLTCALGLLSDEAILELPPGKGEKIRTVEKNDIKNEHDNILKAIAYWHEGKKNINSNHEILMKINEFRSLGEMYAYAGKEKLEELVNSNMFDSDLIKYILEREKK